MDAAVKNMAYDLELGRDLGENFGRTVELSVLDQASSLILEAIDDEEETIKARCRLAYRRELARCLAEHFAKMAGE